MSYFYREIATLTYRSGPEWDERFGRGLVDEKATPSLCPNFLIESYLEHQGESFSTKYDPNSLLYISKVFLFFSIINKMYFIYYYANYNITHKKITREIRTCNYPIPPN